MRAILIPVKDLSRAKQRLAGILPQEARTRLARAMLADVFVAVSGVRSADAVFVASSDEAALDAARSRGWECLPETEQRSESDSVDHASRLCAARGVAALLRLPGDLPLLRASDIEMVLAHCPQTAGAVLVPSRDRTGTNALLRTPPCLFPSHFGPGSLAKHLAQAQQYPAGGRVLSIPRIELDVDDEHDLRALAEAEGVGDHTAALLRELQSLAGLAHFPL
jgi:2-phospho-L-lactate/phosphoenolpyruvate guanylyltransferase